jgi:hypothetical protein
VQAPDYPRLRTAIGKEIERMIERWRRDWVGFGERGARERGKIEGFPLRPQTVPDSEQPLEKSLRE